MEPGEYQILVGASCRDIRLRASVVKTGPAVENPYQGQEFAPYYRADIKAVPDESFRALLGHEPPAAYWDRSVPLGFNDTVYQGSYLKGGLGRFLYEALAGYVRVMTAAGRPDRANEAAFYMNMPYRNLGRLSGLFSDRQMQALLRVVNRERGGLGGFIKEMCRNRG